MPSPDAHDGYAIALDEARRALDEQEREVAGLSARAGTLISAATIATSFLGAPFVNTRHLGLASTVAIGAFVLLSFATLALLWPRYQFEFSLRPTCIVQTFVEPILVQPAKPVHIRRELAIHMGRSAELNRERISRMKTIFRIACVLLTTEIVAWVIAIVVGV